MEKYLEDLTKLNDKYIEGNQYKGPDLSTMFEFFNYDTNVILSAPHSTKSMRAGVEKISDFCTGAITEFIGSHYEKSYIVKPFHIKKAEDIFDFVVSNKISNKYFLDIHGMKMNNQFELAVGLGHFDEASYSEELKFIDILSKKYGFRYVINNPNYMGHMGLTGCMQKYTNKPKVMQLEWSSDFRNFYDYPENIINKTIPFIVEFSNYVENIK